jgi:putative peptide zinc metalloprotease protein
MSEAGKTFSESWYRVANQKICLRPGVRVRRQVYRGERWIVLENPFNNQYFRLRPEAYEFVARLRPDRTVEEVWKECLEKFPETAPGQEAVIRLLSQLYYANLLQYDVAADAARLFERYKKTRQRQTRATLLQVMFMRIPLLNPDRFVQRTLPLVRPFLSWLGAVIWLLVVGYGVKLGIENFDALREQSQGILDPAKLPLLYLAMVIVKTLHEFGHAYFCRRFGGEVPVMGVQLLVFTPVPYMDATSSWGFRSRWQRALVGAAGMIVELFVAAIAMMVWAKTGAGLVHSLCYNLIFIASVSTLIFNLNPLLRFDGYYILSDLLDIPNLYQKSFQHLRHLFEHYLLGVQKSESPTQSHREKFWLTVFGVGSAIYRVIVFGGILLFVADRFLFLGILMAVVCVISWIIVPLGKFIHYLASSPKLERCRPRAVLVSAGGLALLIAFFQFIPFPSHFRAPGVVLAREWSMVSALSAGRVNALLARPGQLVQAGQPLVELVNPELDLALAAARASYAETEARYRAALSLDAASLAPLQGRLDSARQLLQRLEEDKSNLVVRARVSGWWTLPRPEEMPGRWLPKGSALGLIINTNAFEFSATVRQEELDRLFGRLHQQAEVRLFGQGGLNLQLRDLRIIPGAQYVLPTIALGWAGGGEMPVSSQDRQGRLAAEPFFNVIGRVEPPPEAVLLHGRTGKARFDIGREPLLPRAMRALWQLLQKRYQL